MVKLKQQTNIFNNSNLNKKASFAPTRWLEFIVAPASRKHSVKCGTLNNDDAYKQLYQPACVTHETFFKQ